MVENAGMSKSCPFRRGRKKEQTNSILFAADVHGSEAVWRKFLNASAMLKIYKLGILGDATKATREKGEKLVNAVVSKLSEFIEELKSEYPPGVSPLERGE